MASQLGTFLRNADAELIKLFLCQFDLPKFVLPAKNTVRSKTINDYLAAHVVANGGLAAKLNYEVSRIENLNKGQFDRYFNKHVPIDEPEAFRSLNSRDRSLWLYLNDADAFEDIERQLSYDTLSGQKTKATRFETASEKTPEFTAEVVSNLEMQVRDIFLDHDGSGKFVNSHPPSENFDDDTFSLQVSRAPEVQETFEDDGSTKDDTVRKITDVHFRYSSSDGLLLIATSRGGYKVRQRLAEAFAELVLQVNEAPSVLVSEKLKLHEVLSFDLPPAVPNQPDVEIDLVEANVMHWGFSGHHFRISCNGGVDSEALKRISAGDMSNLNVLSLVFRISNYLPEGSSKPCTLRVELHKDGSVNCSALKAEQERLMRILPDMYGLRPNPVTDG